ncbi:hypothetical protein ACVWW4_000041 [Bradyrhizobium sp. LB7.1]
MRMMFWTVTCSGASQSLVEFSNGSVPTRAIDLDLGY